MHCSSFRFSHFKETHWRSDSRRWIEEERRLEAVTRRHIYKAHGERTLHSARLRIDSGRKTNSISLWLPIKRHWTAA